MRKRYAVLMTLRRRKRNLQKTRTPDRYTTIRARLVAKGTTLAAWARHRGWPVTTVYDAARGTRKGPMSEQIVRALQEAIGE